MTQDLFVLEVHRPCAPCMPKLHVGTIRMCRIVALESKFHTYPQIPVLLISTTTSPSPGLAPEWMSSTDGSALSSHRLCCGSVYTPMLGLRFRIDDMVTRVEWPRSRQEPCLFTIADKRKWDIQKKCRRRKWRDLTTFANLGTSQPQF